MKNLKILFATLVLSACASAPKLATEGEKLNAVIKKYTETTKHLDAYEAPYFNIEADLDKFGDYLSPEYFEREKAITRTALTELQTIDEAKLSASEKLTFALFKGNVEIEMGSYDFPREYLSFNQMYNRTRGFIDAADPKLTSFPFNSVKHYEAFVTRAKGFGPYIDRQIAILRKGIAEKVTLNCPTAEKVQNSYKSALEREATKNPFYQPVQKFPDGFSPKDQERLRAAFTTMIREDILPNVQRLDRFMKDEYAPHCRKEFGLSGVPNGDKWYAWAIKARTDLPLTPQHVHELGLSEVARLEKELDDVRKQLGFKGTHAQFLKSISHDAKFFFTDAKEMFQAFLDVKAKVEPKLPAYFSLMPKGAFQIVESGNPEEASGSYRGPTEMQPIGRFVVNTHNIRSVPRYEVTTLLLHEAIPGHHFQIALKFEQKDRLSEYQRKLLQSTSFSEGWALYAEYLGREMGMYEDPMQRLGNLNDELLRAVRLVVDSGIHSMKWSQSHAEKYMAAHLAEDSKDIEIEVNRYSVMPAQALAYKIGQLKIIELRKLAEKTLGDKFDIKEFHRQVIGDGTLTLPVLEQKINSWIEQVRR